MATTLLTTKLYVPQVLPAFVPRPRITERLSVGMAGKLTLITAPAGFGKTTAVSAWLHPQAEAGVGHAFVLHPERVVWVSLDAADNDPISFWAYVLTALEALAPSVGAVGRALHERPPQPIEALLTTLINILSHVSHEIVLVLDDYHVIDTPAIHQAIQFFLEHLPARLHLLIISRSAPPLTLARLRARGQLTELDSLDLRFTADEAARLLIDVMRLPISAADIGALEARTEGWITGLRLAALAMRNRGDCAGFIRAFTGSNRLVLEYLAEEVLARLPGHIQTFLLHTSILDRMCGSLCDAVMGITISDEHGTTSRATPTRDSSSMAHHSSFGDSYSQLLLAELERSNLFIASLDDEQRWYRYHALFVDALRHRLQNGASPQELAALHRRASHWFERHGLASEAAQHALAAQDWDRASARGEQHGLAVSLGNNAGQAPGTASLLADRLSAGGPPRDPAQQQPQAAPPASAALRARSAGLIEPLTERELEVLRLVAGGASNRTIAAQLTVTLGTVKKHLNNIFGKLGAQSRTQALAHARELGLL